MRLHVKTKNQAILQWNTKEILFSYGKPVAAENLLTKEVVFLKDTTRSTNQQISSWKKQRPKRMEGTPSTQEEIDKFIEGWVEPILKKEKTKSNDLGEESHQNVEMELEPSTL